MKYLITLFIVICSLQLAAQYNNQFSSGDYELKGKVKSVLTLTFKAEERFGEPFLLNIVHYGFWQGNLDARNHLIEFNNNQQITTRYAVPKFEKFDNTKSFNELKDEFYEVSYFKYNVEKQVSEEVIDKGTVTDPITGQKLSRVSSKKYFYENEKRMNRIDIINELGNLEYSQRIKYIDDEKHDMTYDSDGLLLWGEINKENPNLKIDSIFNIDESKNISSISVLVYNNEGQLINEKQISNDGIIISEWISVYNEKGLINTSHYLNHEEKKKKITKYTYSYDSRGNWIQKNIYENNELTLSLTRGINYY